MREGSKKTGSVETRLEAMEQQVFKFQGMVERGLNANHMMITDLTNKHRIDANYIGKQLPRLYDRIDQLQAQIYDPQNQNCEMVDDNDPWYDGLIEEFDRKHRARAIENRKRNPPPVNHAALTALMDHWRPETHSFHLACGEMVMTLEDMAMIIGLPINGLAVTGHVSAIN
ncbi:Alpha-L-arabinofuranosidase 1 [Hordeum vulgare]|nr:Alpha-L-arabinofuranosidase 1 [Hordeum vulgare]